MYSREEVTTSREVEAIQIPDGSRIRLPKGERLYITQNLGGNFTVMTERGAMYRIDQKDADALGREATHELPSEEVAGDPEELEEVIWSQLRRCFDPEIPVNIVDLGLVYDCRVEALPDEGYRVEIKMTLTAPGCGMGPVLAEDVRNRVEEIPGVTEAAVEVVFDPPWNQNMMSEAARLQLGFF